MAPNRIYTTSDSRHKTPTKIRRFGFESLLKAISTQLITIHFTVGPSIMIATKVIGVPTGSQTQMECLVEAFPPAISYWLKSGEEMILSGYVLVSDIWLMRVPAWKIILTIIFLTKMLVFSRWKEKRMENYKNKLWKNLVSSDSTTRIEPHGKLYTLRHINRYYVPRYSTATKNRRCVASMVVVAFS